MTATSSTLPLTRLGQEVVTDREGSLEREWLITNGIGGYASSSLSGANTRRYHGLLVAALQPPLGRNVLLSKFEEEVRLADQTYPLSVNEWQSGWASLEGLTYLQDFELEGNLPTFHYKLGTAKLTKSIWMEHGFNTTYIRYSYTNPTSNQPLTLKVRPLANNRDYHGSAHGSSDWNFRVEADQTLPQAWKVCAWDGAPIWRLVAFDQPAEWQPNDSKGWYWGFRYRQEAARGLDATEDLYCIGSFNVQLAPGSTITWVASTADPSIINHFYQGSREFELSRQSTLLEKAHLEKREKQKESRNALDQLAARLLLAADQFIVGRPDPNQTERLIPDYRTIIAGYHWFGDWGRDTMLSLPGLTLVSGRYEEAATLLQSFARFVDKGMLPNRFPDSGQSLNDSDYNTVDATLWYFNAVDKYLTATGDNKLASQLYPVLTEIIRWHVEGTRFNIKVASDGLLFSGAEGVQLTWMDAKIGDWVVTPRRGKPIEISALWYRALSIMQKLSEKWGTAEQSSLYTELAAKIKVVFEETYWYADGGYFYDLINEFGNPDPALRPNQIIAMAVAPELFTPDKARSALSQIQNNLLTPFGLRTLSPHDPAYRPTYGGGPVERDSAYHQGTVWPWLLGPYAQVVLNYAGREALLAVLEPFVEQLNLAGVGQVSEIFGAERPFPPVGCIAQAWSVAQLLEAWQLLK